MVWGLAAAFSHSLSLLIFVPAWLLSEDAYECTLSVDGEDTTLMVIDSWEVEKRVSERAAGAGGGGWSRSPRPGTEEGRDNCIGRGIAARGSGQAARRKAVPGDISHPLPPLPL